MLKTSERKAFTIGESLPLTPCTPLTLIGVILMRGSRGEIRFRVTEEIKKKIMLTVLEQRSG